MNPDLTRWNRAGLKRFRYVDGNAATYLEALRLELIARLAGWDMELLGIELAGASEEERRAELVKEYISQFGKDHQKALENYLDLNDDRVGIAFEMIRSFARSAHVLTEHLDAYANEGFLGTATQWENVRRLVHGLDYHPSPPASAMTRLIINAKPGTSGLVARGMQIRHKPEEGSPIIFETLEDITIDSDLNDLRLDGWNHSPGQTQNVGGNAKLELDRIVAGLNPGEPVVIENADGSLQSCLLKNNSIVNGRTVLELDKAVSGSLGDLTIHLKPVEKLEVFSPVKGQITEDVSSLYLTETPAELKETLEKTKTGKESYVFIGSDNKGIYKKVQSVGDDGKVALAEIVSGNELSNLGLSEAKSHVGMPYILDRLNLDSSKYVTTISPTDIYVKADVLNLYDRDEYDKGEVSLLRNANVLVFTSKANDPPFKGVISSASYAHLEIKGKEEKETVVLFKLIFDQNTPELNEIKQILLPPDDNQYKWKLDGFVDVNKIKANETLKVSAIKRIIINDFCVLACGANLVTARVKDITEEIVGQSGLRLELQAAALAIGSENFMQSQTTVLGKFKEQARLQGWDFNEEPIKDNKKLKLENKDAAKLLTKGKPIVIEQESPPKSFQTTVKSVVDADDGVIELDDALPDGYTTGGAVIRANVVLTGHGETQSERILGSGNATLSNQEFIFPVSNVSFVSDPMQVSGVKADIQITIDGEKWTQVARFNQSRQTDNHYVVWMTEEGHLRVVFGDGVNGRRLPTGQNNVRIAWRMGSGEEGNLKAGLLKKPVHPHPRVESVEQPFECSGGSDMESVTSLRRSAPASLSTMDRAVSVSDFAELAESHSSVWNARSELEWSGVKHIARITVVPAQGRELSDALCKTLKEFIMPRAIPGIHVELIQYESEPLMLDIEIGVNSARFDPTTVEAEVRDALIHRFTLKNRAIGAPVYLSDIYQCVEAARGVEYSICKFQSNEDAQVLPTAGNHGVLHIENADNITITIDEERE